MSASKGIRVIAGTARGKKLKLVPGDSTRPITDRVKENLFNIIGDDIREARLLDLFAGTGSVGIEALSRGAAFVQFVDIVPPAVRVIRENIRATRFEKQSMVHLGDAFDFLKRGKGEVFDYVYIAPPQYQALWIRALQAVDEQRGRLARGAWVIVQIDPLEEETVVLKNLEWFDRRKYGNTVLLFYRNLI